MSPTLPSSRPLFRHVAPPLVACVKAKINSFQLPQSISISTCKYQRLGERAVNARLTSKCDYYRYLQVFLEIKRIGKFLYFYIVVAVQSLTMTKKHLYTHLRLFHRVYLSKPISKPVSPLINVISLDDDFYDYNF